MTAEVAILNRSAVALAADSAVTITVREPGKPAVRKIYANANKLFELIKGRSVGLMVYDSAEFMQVPWETIVKVYRAKNSTREFDTLAEYASDFLQFLRTDISDMVPESSRQRYIAETFIAILHLVLKNYKSRTNELAHSGSTRLTKAIKEQVWDEILGDMEAEAAQYSEQDWADGINEAKFLQENRDLLLKFIPEKFDGIALKITLRRRVAKFLCQSLLRVDSPPGPGTGVVIAGFGETELFPGVFHAEVGGIIGGKLSLYGNTCHGISGDRQSMILPFAQINEAVTFLIGIDPQMQEAVIDYWNEWSQGLREAALSIVESEVPGIDPATAAQIGQRYDVFVKESWDRFASMMATEFHDRRFGPMEASAAFLSKGELANLAENLIDLASLRNRVSLDRDETVGGAVDVAVISKGDGFVWIKRKHYFDLEYNPVWAGRQLSQQADRTGDSNRGVAKS